MNHRDLLSSIHDEITWYEKEEDIPVSDNWFDFREQNVYQTLDGKWVFAGREYRRQGQANKAAWLVFKESKK